VSKLERLLKLTATLLNTYQPLSADEIQRRVEGYPQNHLAFRRAFERDKDDLREMGVPITVARVPEVDPPLDGYRILPGDYYLDDPGLEPDELAALTLAAQLVHFEGASSDEALWKLGGRQGQTTSGGELAAVATDPTVTQLFDAVRDRSTVSFAYGGTDRELEPWRLSHQRGRWYVSGFDRARESERNFRIDRIEGDLTVGRTGSFERPPEIGPNDRQPWQFDEAEELSARVLVDADQAPWAKHQLGAETVVDERADGSVEFEIRVSNLPAFRSFVLSFLEHAEVLSPPEVRQDIVQWLEGLAGREEAAT